MTYAPDVAATLSGASLRQLAYWRSGRGGAPLLRPRSYRRGGRVSYSFDDVVALRTIVFLRAKGVSLQKIRKAVDELRELGEIEHPSRYRLIAVGRDIVWRRSTSEALALTGASRGQHVIAELVDILASFQGPHGKVVALDRPVAGISVDRSILAGFPVVEGTRVPYRQVASLVVDGIEPREIRAFYPSVSAAGAKAAVEFARLVAHRHESDSAAA